MRPGGIATGVGILGVVSIDDGLRARSELGWFVVSGSLSGASVVYWWSVWVWWQGLGLFGRRLLELRLLLLRLCPSACRSGVRLLLRLLLRLWVVLLAKFVVTRPRLLGCYELRLLSQIRRLLGKSSSSCPLLVPMWMDRRLVRVGVSVCVLSVCVCVCVCVLCVCRCANVCVK